MGRIPSGCGLADTGKPDRLTIVSSVGAAMETVNIHEAKTQLSKLVAKAVAGEPFVISKAGEPLVRVTALAAPVKAKRLGFLEGEIDVPDDFDRLHEEAIRQLFEGDE